MNYKDLEQEQMIGYWVKRKGLKHKDLSSHPQIDDCVLLVRFRDEYWTRLNVSERAHWAAVWEWCYHKQKPLKDKHLNKLEQAIIDSDTRHLQYLVKSTTERQKIKARRNLCQIQRDDDMTAKTSLADTSVPWEV